MATISPEQAANYAYQAGFRGGALANIVAIAMAESGDRNNPGSALQYDVINNNPSTNDYSVGLTQINLFGNLAAGRIQELQSLGYNVSNLQQATQALQNPLTNFRMAYLISSSGANFAGPWAGDYENFSANWAGRLAAAKVAIGAFMDGSTVPPSTSPGNTTPSTNGSSGGGGGGSIPVIGGIEDAFGNITNAAGDIVGGPFKAIDNVFSATLGSVKTLANPHTWYRLFFILSGFAIAALGGFIFAKGMMDDAVTEVGKGIE